MGSGGPAPLDLGAPRRIHVVAIGGSGMSAIAEVLVAMGHRVSGSDLHESAVLERLRGLGVATYVGHDAAQIGDADSLAVSSAVGVDNPEVRAAVAAGVPVYRRADVLAAICAQRRTIAVAGTHGKTTTSAMLATILLGAGRDPSFIVGGELLGLRTGARWADGEWMVVEADESDGTFVELPAEVAVVTSVEPDHLEHWGGFDALVAAFDRFVAGAAGGAVVCADDPVAAGVARRHASVTYGFADGADEHIVDFGGARHGSHFEVEHGGARRGAVTVNTPGRHNALNAAAAITAAGAAGMPFGEATAALARFEGVARRFHVRGERAGVTYVDEYAHLPGEVRASLAAAREGGWRRIVCAFQPHRFSRTEALWADFGHAFDNADVLAVTEIYPAGEPARPGVTGKLIVEAVLEATPHRRVAWLPTRAGLLTFLRRELRPGDLCLTLGAGDLTTLPGELLGEMP